MKLHIFMAGTQSLKVDIDKKLPHVIKTYPGSKVEKQTVNGKTCIYAADIAPDVTLNELLNIKTSSTVNIDMYAFSDMSYSLFDISFELDDSIIKPLIEVRDYGMEMLTKTSIVLEGKVCPFVMLLTKYAVAYYGMEKQMNIQEDGKHKELGLNEQLEMYSDKIGVRPYAINGVHSSLNVSPEDTLFIFEDYKNQFDINDTQIKSITHDNMIYVDDYRNIYICKNKNYYKGLWDLHLLHNKALRQLNMAISHAHTFLYNITKQGVDVRKNIDEENQNSYYWKKLKKTIELMDLNFLEFHSDAVGFINHDPVRNFGTNFPLLNEYRIKVQKKRQDRIDKLKINLDEVKYAISNLSTPSHTHDEDILQKETEKVNDRILMLSFIAMAVSAIGMMRSNDIEPLFKILSGVGIISLPLFYYMARSLQKKISKRNNKNNELKRKLNERLDSINKSKAELEDLKDSKDIHKEFIEEVISFREQFIVSEQKKIDSLKKKIK